LGRAAIGILGNGIALGASLGALSCACAGATVPIESVHNTVTASDTVNRAAHWDRKRLLKTLSMRPPLGRVAPVGD